MFVFFLTVAHIFLNMLLNLEFRCLISQFYILLSPENLFIVLAFVTLRCVVMFLGFFFKPLII